MAGYRPALTLQQRQPAAILLAYKKAQVWADFVCLDLVSPRTNIPSFLATRTSAEVEMGRDEKEVSTKGDNGGTFCTSSELTVPLT